MKESEIINGLKNNNQEVFRYFVMQNQVRIIRVCMGLLQNREDAEEIAQDVFIEVFRSIANFKGQSSLATWLYRIAINKSLNLLKKNKSRKWLVNFESLFYQGEKDTEGTVNNSERPDGKIEQKEMNIIMQKVLNQLPEKQRIALTLHKYENISHKEIAEIMSVSVPAVESLIFRAKNQIRRKYSHVFRS